MWYKSVWKTFLIILKTLVFKSGESHLEFNYGIYFLYGIVPFILALIGLYFAFKNAKMRILIWWFLSSFLLLLFYYVFDYSIFARNQRIIYFFMLNLVLLSAVGLIEIIKYFNRKIGNKKSKNILVVFLLIAVFLFSFYNYGKLENKVKLYYLIDDDGFKALSFLKDKEDGILIAPLKEAVTDYSIAGKRAVAKFYPPYDITDDKIAVEKFYSSDCLIKEKIVRDYNIKYALSKEKLACNWKEIYSNNYFIYEFGR